jgi:arabinose-5-phosphate isomerase
MSARPAPTSPCPDLAAAGRRVVRLEAEALAALESRIGTAFERACALLLECRGRVVCTGMGKSGHIARKIAATLASTGTPAFYLHPGEASHGDLGMVTGGDVVLALSYSGESDEILTIVPALKRLGVPLIAVSGRPGSTLAGLADLHLDVSVPAEACPHNLAPTTSTTASLALGDALAVAVLEARGFTPEDFARSHPAGALGRRLLLTIRDVMHAGEAVPRVRPEASIAEALVVMSRGRLGMTAVVDEAERLVGVFTDGDLRRALDNAQLDVRRDAVWQVMGRSPKTIGPGELASAAVHAMEAHKVNALVVVDDEGRVVGALNFIDLLRARVV